MSRVWNSNKPYTGLIKLRNTIDLITSVAEKAKYIKSALEIESVNTSAISDATAASIFDSFYAHRQRVVADGGVVASNSKTIKAIHFATTNSLTNYVALSAAFGYKASSVGVPSKLYSVSGATYDAIVDVPDRVLISGLDIIGNTDIASSITSQASLLAKNPIFALSGEHLVTNTGAIQLVTQNTVATSGVTTYERLDLNALSSGINALVRNATDTSSSRSLSSGKNYNKKGVALFLAASQIELHTPVLTPTPAVYSYAEPRKDMSAVPVYVNAKTVGKNAIIREIWFVSAGSSNLAKNLAASIGY